ncbi:MAG TPA: hypothetical protein VK992_06125 [Candidatus Caenarcaniphilales bacterium]|nr:hypothetical protein [Candidatus Caenarcaniphilales bacterium]
MGIRTFLFLAPVRDRAGTCTSGLETGALGPTEYHERRRRDQDWLPTSEFRTIRVVNATIAL